MHTLKYISWFNKINGMNHFQSFSNLSCPRCKESLLPGTYEQQKAFLCNSCNGVLIHQKSLISILESLSAEITTTIPLHTVIDKIPDKNDSINCPGCFSKMDRHGYMGSNTVMIDTCPRCASIWIDPLEFGSMSLLYARTTRRVDHHKNVLAQTDDDIVGIAMLSAGFITAFRRRFIYGSTLCGIDDIFSSDYFKKSMGHV